MLKVIDDSLRYYQAFAGGVVPPERGGKFVVVRNSQMRYAIFSIPKLATYHAHIVKSFLGNKGISGTFDEENGTFSFDTSSWTVEGGGKWRFDERSNKLNIFGSSMAYGRVDLDELASGLESAGAFSGATVEVGI